MPKLILASNSPRRKDLLTLAGYVYEIVPSDGEELMSGADSFELVRLNAMAKAKEVGARFPDSVVLGADTVVSLNGVTLGKPKDEKDAFEMLKSLSDTEHSVLTGYAVVKGDVLKSGVCETKVRFRKLSDNEINAYVATKEPLDKAGAYGIQEKASIFVDSFQGDFFNIIGLPVAKVHPVLAEFGILPHWQKKILCKNQQSY